MRSMLRIHMLHPFINKLYYKIYLGVNKKNSKSRNVLFLSFPRSLSSTSIEERESREIIPLRSDWTPAFAGVTALEIFYETIKDYARLKSLIAFFDNTFSFSS